MFTRYNEKIKGLGLCTDHCIFRNEVVFELQGVEYDHPKRETIHVGNNIHIWDESGIYMNHSFQPTTRIEGYKVIALRDIEKDEELTFNYNDSEINMACPFSVENKEVIGRTVISSNENRSNLSGHR